MKASSSVSFAAPISFCSLALFPSLLESAKIDFAFGMSADSRAASSVGGYFTNGSNSLFASSSELKFSGSA